VFSSCSSRFTAQSLVQNLDKSIVIAQLTCGEFTVFQLKPLAKLAEAVAPIQVIEVTLANVKAPAHPVLKT
jgi:hypothetical protein